MTFRRVQPGDPLDISAAWHNAVTDLITSSEVGGGAVRLGSWSPARILVRNATGGSLARFDCVGLSGSPINPAVNPQGFVDAFVVDATHPQAERAIAVVQQPLAANAVGWAVVIGATPVRVSMADESHKFARPVIGTAGAMVSGRSGPVRILAVDGGTGTKTALALLDDQFAEECCPPLFENDDCCGEPLIGPPPCGCECCGDGGGGGEGDPKPPTIPACCQEIMIEREPCRARYLNVGFTSDQTCTFGRVYSSDRTFIFGEITIDEWHAGNFWHRFPVNRTLLFRIPCFWVTYPTWANTGPGGTSFDWFPLPSYVCYGPGQPLIPPGSGDGGSGGGGGGINQPPDYGDRTPYIWDTPWYPAPGGGDAGLWSPRRAVMPFASAFGGLYERRIDPELAAEIEQIAANAAPSGWWSLGTESISLSSTPIHDWSPSPRQMYLLNNTLGSPITITGLAIGQVDGQMVYIKNESTLDNIILAWESGSSAAANRFNNAPLSGSDTLTPGARVGYMYSAAISRWVKIL